MSKTVEYQELIAFHPGTHLEEIVVDWDVMQTEFVTRFGGSTKTISKIINGEENISATTADKLAKATGISMATWLNLQTQYDSKIAEITCRQEAAGVTCVNLATEKNPK